MVDLEEVEQFFFKAMLQGYAGSGAQKIQGFPRCKTFTWKEDGWNLCLVDTWYTNPNSKKSAGHTTIFWRDIPVWFMSYGGHYPKEVIPLLKKALYMAYEGGNFLGGRGIECAMGDWLYDNHPQIKWFSEFQGYEEIEFRPNGTVIGRHDYWGMALI